MSNLTKLLEKEKNNTLIVDLDYIIDTYHVDVISSLDPDIDYEVLFEEEFCDALSDYISDSTGFCHKGFNYNVKNGKVIISNIQWDYSE